MIVAAREREQGDENGAPRGGGSGLSASAMTVDGTSFKTLACNLEQGGLLGPLAIAKGVSTQRKALDACVKRSTDTPVKIISATGKFTKVEASGPDAAVNRCVERALSGKPAALSGSCTMVVAHGK
jgi:hypothetical protein